MCARNHLTHSKKHVTFLVGGIVLAALMSLSTATGQTPQPATPTTTAGIQTPLLAYYYIWFNPSSWDRAKTDYPLLGRYSSDDSATMRAHIRLAKQVGITGFIVSWKSSDVLNRRLERLVDVAESENFKLAIMYQGLDFDRDPLSAERVAADLDYFIANFASRPAFALFERPMVIWSGTWEFSQSDIAAVTSSRRGQLLILASERNPSDYQRLAADVDGDAYYWSSVDPESFPGYQEKLDAMSRAVQAAGGRWIAPAAPGFDARQIGGEQIVDRKGGETLRRELNAALNSSPDAIGIISWNEFSENSQIEPSRQYDDQSLTTLAEMTKSTPPDTSGFDSDAPAATGPSHGIPLLLGLLALVALNLFIIVRRHVRRRQPGLEQATEGPTSRTGP